MCNCYRITASPEDLRRAMAPFGPPLLMDQGLPNLEPQDNLRPTNRAPILRPRDPRNPMAGVDIAIARWDLVPWFWKAPVKEKKFLATNCRSETASTTAAFREAFRRRRCLVPANGFYEWTGEKGAKTKWLFTASGRDVFFIAGLWDRAETADGVIESYTLLTTRPGPDMAPYHTRQVVVLEPVEAGRWLDLDDDPTDLFGPRPAGGLLAERLS